MDLFQAQVEKTPENIAVVFEEETLTYRELNQKANQLARYLISLGVGPETLVGICVERSLEMMIGLLGILKAGGAYVPLDPDYPRERLRFMLADAKVPVLLSQSRLLERLPLAEKREERDREANVVCLDKDWDKIAACAEENPAKRSEPENLAYVIYTSGSTGKPKGVMLEHAALINFLSGMRRLVKISETDKLLAVTTLSFDIAALELYLPLTAGSQTIIVSRETAGNGETLLRELADKKITVMQATPATWKLLLQSGRLQSTPLTILCGGEALPAQLGRELLDNSRQLWNVYGPTETTIWSSAHDITLNPEKPELIGRPIANTRIYILDANHRPLPPGIPGELCIAGVGLARGYLNRPELTAEKFVEVELFGETERLYKTGDLARYLDDGNLEYLGRLDHQVKLRGFRVELGEIEAALTRHPEVQEAAVILEGKSRDKRLLAYFTPGLYKPSAENPGALGDEARIDTWRKLWNEAYVRPVSAEIDPEFNTSGWNSSYTRSPLSNAEMKEWRDGAVKQILARSPARILEIGCGTGLLLFPIAPFCDNYTGTDISLEALSYIEKQIEREKKTGKAGPKVKLFQRATDNFEGLKRAAYDTVILNSVVQYFPSVDYLINVLKGAIKTVAPGGCIFLGDVRNYKLLEAFHTSVQFYQAPDSLPLAELKQRTQNALRKEKELLIDPEFFIALKHALPEIARVQIQLKPGYVHNEITRFRYDVTLYIGGESFPERQFQWLDWRDEKFTLAQVRERLLEKQADLIGFKRIPNARLQAEKKALEQPAQPEETAGTLRKLIGQMDPGIDPEEFRALADELSYACYITYCDDFSYNAVFQTRTSYNVMPYSEEVGRASKRPWQSYANPPFQDRVARDNELTGELREFLKQTLPSYMIPARLIALESMPLTPNGKIDRKALPEVALSAQTEWQAPRTKTERLLCECWTQILDVEVTGIQSHFFEFGGHSLSATQLIARVREIFGIEMPLQVVFERAILKEMAAWISRQQHGSQLLPLTPRKPGEPPVLSPAQQYLWPLARREGRNVACNVSNSLRLQGKLDEQALERALTTLVERHESLRFCFPAVAGEAQAQVNEVYNPLKITDLSELSPIEQERQVNEWTGRHARLPFDLETGPLLSVRLLKLSEDEQILLFTIHQMISDGWSMGVLFREWSQLYRACVENQEVLLSNILPELEIQYGDYAAWQSSRLKIEILERQLTYWKKKLADAPELLKLPTDYPRPAEMGYRGKHIQSVWEPELTRGIKELSGQQNVTVFMTLLAAFNVLLFRHSEQTDLLVGSPIANRIHRQTEDLIGLFMNTLVFRTRIKGDETFLEILKQVKQTAHESYNHQDIPFEQLVEEIKPVHSPAYSPLIQVVFALHNMPLKAPEFGDLAVSFLESERMSVYDLTLNIIEQDETFSCGWRYNPDLFHPTTISRMDEHFQELLGEILKNPEQSFFRRGV